MGRTRRGGDHVGYGLGLRKVHLPGQVGADGEFARIGRAGSGSNCQPENLRDDILRSVARNLGGIFARIGVRCAKNRDEYVVDDPLAVENAAVVYRVTFGIGERPASAENPVADGQRFVAAQPDNG